MGLPIHTAGTIIECLEHYAASIPQARAYTFLSDGDKLEQVLTYEELRTRAMSYAVDLLDGGLAGQTVILLFPPGLEFIVAFFACAYAQVVAVPSNLARNSQHYNRLQRIIVDSDAQAILSAPELRASILNGLTDNTRAVGKLRFLEEPKGSKSRLPIEFPKPQQLSFIQYTSGSTNAPKGVMVTHAKLMANERAIQQAASLPEHVTVAGWLPHYHDMGLIGTTLQPISLGGHYVFISPIHFLQHPPRWLKIISHYRASVTAAPNFALERLVETKLLDEEDKGLDISCLTTIFCGAEPVKEATIERFNRRFEHMGLDRGAIQPCYGLAEATLLISGGPVPTELQTLHLERVALENGNVDILEHRSSKTLQIVCCGRPIKDHVTIVVDPATGEVLPDRKVGEIWFAGESVSDGYWNDKNASISTFNAVTACGRKAFLRTGDLGFLHNGGLFVTGRLKEVIIIRGRNIYPHDVEITVQDELKQLGSIKAAVFDWEVVSRSNIVVYVELPRAARRIELLYGELRRLLRQRIMATHDIEIADVIFLRCGGMPLTSSGKIQRRLCAQMYASGDIKHYRHTVG